MTAGAFETDRGFRLRQPHRDLLIADRVTTEARIVSLERDWTGIVESSAMTSTDDEHDPEGATIAFERAQIETLIEVAREHLDEIDDALERVRTGALRHVRRLRSAHRRRPSRGAAVRDHLHQLRVTPPLTRGMVRAQP